MVARSDEVKCLMLLSRIGQQENIKGGRDQKRVFKCKTCLKEFHSFQALGGHRASHKKIPRNETMSSLMTTKKAKTKCHACSICGVEFPMGQALGGHMRRHKNESNGGVLITRALLPEKTVTCSDLSLGMVENLNLKLELGRTVY